MQSSSTLSRPPSRAQLLRPDEVADLLRCSTRQVRYLAAEGAFPKVVLGHRTLRYRLADIEALIAERTHNGAHPAADLETSS
jgi:predicted DNA-binding transcriptional regulator AlpA